MVELTARELMMLKVATSRMAHPTVPAIVMPTTDAEWQDLHGKLMALDYLKPVKVETIC